MMASMSDSEISGINSIETEDHVEDEQEDTRFTDNQDKRKMVLLDAYGSGVKRPYQKATMSSFTRAVRKLAIPKIKFLPTSKAFGSFEQPDLTDPDCWVNNIFEFMNMKHATDRRKAQVWMTYRQKVKEQFSLHRSSVTSKIKTKFIQGEPSN